MTADKTMGTPAVLAGVLLLLLMYPAMTFSATAGPGEVTLPGTRMFELASPDTGDRYLIQVAEPEAPAPENGYSVLYLLDGNAYLPLMQAARDTLLRAGPREGSPLLIVAIGYPGTDRFDFNRRARDFTPPGAAFNKPEQSHGGAERFLTFLTGQLKPEIRQRYPVNSDKEVLAGHSLGGLFTLYALAQSPGSFERFISISPSLWWLGEAPVQALVQQLADEQAGQTAPRILLAVGEREQSRAMVENVSELARWLTRNRPGWALQTEVFAGAGHGSVMWPAAQRTMEFVAPDQ